MMLLDDGKPSRQDEQSSTLGERHCSVAFFNACGEGRGRLNTYCAARSFISDTRLTRAAKPRHPGRKVETDFSQGESTSGNVVR